MSVMRAMYEVVFGGPGKRSRGDNPEAKVSDVRTRVTDYLFVKLLFSTIFSGNKASMSQLASKTLLVEETYFSKQRDIIDTLYHSMVGIISFSI